MMCNPYLILKSRSGNGGICFNDDKYQYKLGESKPEINIKEDKQEITVINGLTHIKTPGNPTITLTANQTLDLTYELWNMNVGHEFRVKEDVKDD